MRKTITPESSQHTFSSPFVQARLAVLAMLGVLAGSALAVLGWFTQEGKLLALVQAGEGWLNSLYRTPEFIHLEQLCTPTLSLWLGALGVMSLSPQPRPWSRSLVVLTLIALTGQYYTWRLSTLNLAGWVTSGFSVGLLGLETIVIISNLILLFLMLQRQPPVPVAQVEAVPSVDVFIPTYNEPAFILQRTVIGCQALDYPCYRVYLLDDTRRPEVRALAQELGCNYITRPDNRHAKAGNLNHALSHTQGDLIAVFDADFIPTKNFLQRTVGFFGDPQIALVQTPQSFYNCDPIARNLGLENVLTNEEEVFYRHVEPIRQVVGSVICSGTSFVARRRALEQTDGFFTDSLSEDYFTGVQLSALGYGLVYLNEKLSAGLAAENIGAQAIQRLRWARGTLQAFFIKANPLTIPGLSILQRLAHSEGLLHWFTNLARVAFLVAPLAYSFFGVIPIRAAAVDLIRFFVPYYLLQLTTFSWLNHRSRSAFLSDIYEVILAFPLAVTVIQVLCNPFGRGFQVTPKGNSSHQYRFNWPLGWPLVLLFVLTALSLWRNLGFCLINTLDSWYPKGLSLGWLWSTYNLIILALALLVLLDVPAPDPYPWFDLSRPVRLRVANQDYWGNTTMISEGGALVTLTSNLAVPLPLPSGTLEVMGEGVCLPVQLEFVDCQGELPQVQLRFLPAPLAQTRLLIALLYCRPGQWKSLKAPGELQALGIILRILLRPRIFSGSPASITPVQVGQL